MGFAEGGEEEKMGGGWWVVGGLGCGGDRRGREAEREGEEGQREREVSSMRQLKPTTERDH